MITLLQVNLNGVVPYGDVSYHFSQGVDNDGQNEAGDMFYFGWTSDLSYRGDSPDVEGNGESNESETYPETILILSVVLLVLLVGMKGLVYHLKTFTLEMSLKASGDETENGYGQGGQGKVLLKLHQSNLKLTKPKFVFKSPLSDEFITNASNSPNGKYIKDQSNLVSVVEMLVFHQDLLISMILLCLIRRLVILYWVILV